MATFGTWPSLTNRDQSHQDLWAQRANFQALLTRRWVQDYAVFQTNLTRLNEEIQTLRTGNPADLMARWGIEAARQDMERFFNQFMARVEATPQGIHAIAQAINPSINIQAFERSPARELWQRFSQQVLQELRQWNGPFDVLRIAVEQSQNTDLYVLFSLFAAARTAFQNAQNPQAAQANEDRVQELERQRAYLTRVNDEIAGSYRAFDRQETNASLRTWGSRALNGTIGAVVTAIAMNLSSGPKANTAPAVPPMAATPTTVNVTVNVGTTITLGHNVSRDSSGTITVSPSGADKATTINGTAFQFNDVVVGKDGTISGSLNYQFAWKETATLSVKSWDNKLSDWSTITLKRVNDKLQVSYKGTTINY